MTTSAGSGLLSVLPATAGHGADGRLLVGGRALADIAAEFGTPALVFDEQGLRERAREYRDAFRARHPATDVHFASKALPCAPVLRILAEEGVGCDVASAGELAIALAAGFNPAHILLHGNAKSDRDIGDALAAEVSASRWTRRPRCFTASTVSPGSIWSGCTSTSARSRSTSTASAAPPRRSPRSATSASTTSAAGSGSPTRPTSERPRWRTTPRPRSPPCTTT